MCAITLLTEQTRPGSHVTKRHRPGSRLKHSLVIFTLPLKRYDDSTCLYGTAFDHPEQVIGPLVMSRKT